MEFLDPAIDDYVVQHTSPHSALLEQLYRETHLNVLIPRMISGHLQGRTLSMLSHMIRPTNILEVGTYTGYSGICLSEGLTENGTLFTMDINEELESMVNRYFDAAEIQDKVDYRIGNALEIIPTIDATLDLVFIDADKENYSNYYDLVFDQLRPGGFIIADNVLWSGKVADANAQDSETNALRNYSKKVLNDDRVENVLFPIRDGLMVARKL